MLKKECILLCERLVVEGEGREVESRVFRLSSWTDGVAVYADGKDCEQTCVAR